MTITEIQNSVLEFFVQLDKANAILRAVIDNYLKYDLKYDKADYYGGIKQEHLVAHFLCEQYSIYSSLIYTVYDITHALEKKAVQLQESIDKIIIEKRVDEFLEND